MSPPVVFSFRGYNITSGRIVVEGGSSNRNAIYFLHSFRILIFIFPGSRSNYALILVRVSTASPHRKGEKLGSASIPGKIPGVLSLLIRVQRSLIMPAITGSTFSPNSFFPPPTTLVVSSIHLARSNINYL